MSFGNGYGYGRQIVVFASDLASAIDQHPYRPKEETALAVWKRFDRTSFAFRLALGYMEEVYELTRAVIKDKPLNSPLPDEVESQLGKRAFTKVLREVFTTLEWRALRRRIMEFIDTKEFREAKEKVLLNALGESVKLDEAMTTLCNEEKKTVEEKVQEVCKKITQETGKDVDKRTQEALRSKLSKDRGTKLEAKTVKEFATVSGKAVRREPAKLYRKLMDHGDISWMLCGRVDARDENTIVEVKNRTKRFMCPEYDVLQLQAYMFLCGKTKGILLERLHGENRETPFEFNQSFWNEAVVPALYEFVRDVEEKVLMSRSILDDVAPSPRKGDHGLPVMSSLLSPRKQDHVLPVTSLSPKKLDHGLLMTSSLSPEKRQHDLIPATSPEVKKARDDFHELPVDKRCPQKLEGSSWDYEGSSDIELSCSGSPSNKSFALYLSLSETESDEELANLPLDSIINYTQTKDCHAGLITSNSFANIDI